MLKDISEPSQPWDVEQANKVYGVDKWGKGYFSIAESGDLYVTPNPEAPNHHINLKDVINEMNQLGIQFPAVVRFHDILRSQVKLLNETFASVIEKADYQGKYFGVFPIKVNQMREVVEEVVSAGSSYNYGLEAGSKPELLAALAYNTNPDALTILNGYKDEDYMRLALLGAQMGRKVILVIEKFSELSKLITIAEEVGVRPLIGLRSKLMVKGKGKWQNSSGEKAKFGLTYVEMLNAIAYLEEHGYKDCIKLLHFHIGSQLPDIRSIKDAVQEASMVYVNLVKYGVPLEYIDVGGGLAVDYDGSRSTDNSSCNYTKAEYVADIVWGLKQNCDISDIPHPNIVSESGRAVAAYHSCVITKVMGEIKPNSTRFETDAEKGEHILISNMREVGDYIRKDKLQEAFNDLQSLKEQVLAAFNLGVVSLKELAKSEALYWQYLDALNNKLRSVDQVPEELQQIGDLFSAQYLANFSVFQSAIDCWAIGQVLPVIPISRLDELPTRQASLADITCDSDGKIDHFIANETGSQSLPLHKLNEGEDYYLGIFLTGAYQDVMGDMHNLFGRVNEVHIVSHEEEDDGYYIEEVVKGANMGGVLSAMQYNVELMALAVKREIDQQVSLGNIKPRTGVSLVDFYEENLTNYTYLSD